MNPNLDIACTSLAKSLLFGILYVSDLDSILCKHSVKFRKGKTVDDIRDAIKKGVKAGHQKTEFEISMVACYLAKVVKLA